MDGASQAGQRAHGEPAAARALTLAVPEPKQHRANEGRRPEGPERQQVLVHEERGCAPDDENGYECRWSRDPPACKSVSYQQGKEGVQRRPEGTRPAVGNGEAVCAPVESGKSRD